MHFGIQIACGVRTTVKVHKYVILDFDLGVNPTCGYTKERYLPYFVNLLALY